MLSDGQKKAIENIKSIVSMIIQEEAEKKPKIRLCFKVTNLEFINVKLP